MALAALAGYVDAVGFLVTGGYFVSFMSGNSTRLAVGLSAAAPQVVTLSALPIAAFVLGVIASSLVARWARNRRAAAVLGLVAALLIGAAIAGESGMILPAIGLAAAAMGSENALFERDGEVAIGLTYMTGALVKFGQGLAAHISGQSRYAWMPYLALWMGLVAGAVAGAFAYAHFGAGALWIAAGAFTAAALIAFCGSRDQFAAPG